MTPTLSSTPDGRLQRRLSARQVQMIAIAGTLGTGIFLGTGRSLASGGPASMLICYLIVGFIVYVTLLLLGEMATQYPVAGSFNAYVTRFFSPSYGFALAWNYWFNDAVSMASDLTAAQLLLEYWTSNTAHTWIVSAAFWVFLVLVNAAHAGAYGELEYWLSTLKVATIVIFIILGVAVNCGANQAHHYIGGEYWRLPGAPFVGGFGGFARVFVTASFAYGGTESLGITAGETRNPGKNMPRVVKFVFWRILLFYVLSVLLIGLNVPYTYPGLSTKSTTTSPFTIVFTQVGSTAGGSFMNAVILSSVLSGGNHALFAGTRVLYSLAQPLPDHTTPSKGLPRRLAPAIFGRTTKRGVPIYALLATSSVSLLCIGASFVGSGELWGWLQNLVGVSNQIAWVSIGIASWRFRAAWTAQGRPREEMVYRAAWTWGWGPPFVVFATIALILIQGWSSFAPFDAVDFVSLYIELPLMGVMATCYWLFIGRKLQRHTTRVGSDPEDHVDEKADHKDDAASANQEHPDSSGWLRSDLVNRHTVNLYADEVEPTEEDEEGPDGQAMRTRRKGGRWGWAWRVYYIIA